MRETVLDRFLRYVAIDTQSKEDSATYPSTDKQWDLLRLLEKELKELGVPQVSLDTYGYVMASIPSNQPGKNIPAVGFISHVDTSPEVSGANVKPQIISYQGGDLTLPGDPTAVIRESECPSLTMNVGKKIVTTDGTTLLGADDKAGIAIIMTMVDTLMSDTSIPHGDIKIGFTPDEEVGAGTKFFDIPKFGAEFAYTVDGETPGEINKETFSANQAVITVHGRDIHPGFGKNIMVNAIRIIADIIARLPKDMAPETTDGYQPYIHPYVLEGGIGKSTLKVLFRDFETPGLDVLKMRVEKILDEVRAMWPKASIELQVNEQYRNMKEGVAKDPRVAEYLHEATMRAGLKPEWIPIRGGTDGSRLTEKGLPTPNIFTGAANFHSRTEWCSIWGMETSVDTVLHLIKIWAEKS